MQKLSILNRLVLLSTVLLLALVSSNLILVKRLTDGSVVLEENELLARHLGTAVEVSQVFGDFKYWLLELAINTREQSEQQALDSRDSLERGLVALEPFDPETVAVLRLDIGSLLDTTLIAIESYQDGVELRGDEFLAKGLDHVRAVDRRVDGLVTGLEAAMGIARRDALDAAAQAERLSRMLTIGMTLVGVVLTLLVVHSITSPLGRLVNAMGAILEGDLDAPIPRSDATEIGAMTRALVLLRESLMERTYLVAEQERAQADARRSEVRLADVIESVSEGFCLLDSDDRLVMCNERFRQIVGPAGRGLMAQGTPFEDILRGTVDHQLVRQARGREDAWLGERLAMHRNPGAPHIHQRADGRWLRVNERTTQDGGTVSVYMDITDLKNREEELAVANREKDRTLRELHVVLDTMEDGIMFMDADLRARVWNRAFIEMWGFSEEFLRRHPTMAEMLSFNRHSGLYSIDESDWDGYVESRVAEVRAGEVPPYEMHRRDGRVLEYQGYALPDGGRMLFYVDTTERSHALAALSRSEERYALAVQGSNDGLWDWDLEPDRVYMSPRLREIIGVASFSDHAASGELLGLIHPDDVERHHEAMRAHFHGADDHYVAEYRLRGDDGTYRWILTRGLGKRDGGGRVHRMAGSITDITERKAAEIALREAKEQAEAATRTKDRFIANMSHELRTPLNAVIGITEMLKEEAEEEANGDLVEPLDRVLASGRHLLAIINDLLDLSKIEAGHLDLRWEPLDVPALVDELATTTEVLAAGNRNQLEVRCEDGIGEILSDVTRVRQVLLNLLSNACKFTDQGTVRISARRADDASRSCVEFTVEDTGIGMSENEQAEAFEEFSQADTSSTRRYGGAGLGLAISRRLCHLLGGEIALSSEPGKGTSFRVSFPLDGPVDGGNGPGLGLRPASDDGAARRGGAGR